jgi:hypothetical protein
MHELMQTGKVMSGKKLVHNIGFCAFHTVKSPVIDKSQMKGYSRLTELLLILNVNV